MEQTMTSSPMKQTMVKTGDIIPDFSLTTPNIICEACNIQVHRNSYDQHVSGKKHKLKQQQYDQKYKKIFVSGTGELGPKDLQKIFKQFGEISKVDKHEKKPFAFILFVDKDSVEKALKRRVFAGGKRLFVRRYNDNKTESNTPTRKLSETLSNTSQTEGEAETGARVGLQDLPVQLPDLEWCPKGEDELLWMAKDVISQVELSAEMYHRLNEVKSDVENLFTTQLPGCQAVIFGSCGSTLAFKNSDVDLFLQTASGEQPNDFVRREAKEIYRCKSQFRVIARIPNARVPIIKFEHLRTGWQVDLTTNSQLGVCNSSLIRFLVFLDPRIRPLVMLIKYWAKVCGVTGTHSKLTTYSLVMLVIFYLQQLEPPVLPTIAQLQQMSQHKQYCVGWECSFSDEEWRVQSECIQQANNLSMREMLTGFFRFYYNFDFENNVICPLLGRSIPIIDFESVDGSNLPNEMFLYKERLNSDPSCKFRTKDVYLRVQDPFELCLNITRNVAEGSFFVFRQACKVSLELCEKESNNTLLKSLFSIDRESLVPEGSLKLVMPFKEEISDRSETLEHVLVEWYELTTEAIELVLRQILKFSVDSNSVEVSSKVKKLEMSQDVHTTTKNLNSDNSVFLCHGKSNVWNNRKKMDKLMNALKVPLKDFEREVCISNSLYSPNDKNSFSFTLAMSSLEVSKERGNKIEVEVNIKKCKNPIVNGFIQFMKKDFGNFVHKASGFINKLKSSSPMTEVKESLKDLFKLKLESLPDLRELTKINSRQEKSDKTSEKQTVLMRSLDSNPHSIMGKEEFKTTPCFNKTVGSVSSEQRSEILTPIVGKLTLENAVENEMVVPENHTCYTMPHSETQTLVNSFLKPKNTMLNALDNCRSDLENSEIKKCNDLLKTIKKIETKSTFTSDEVNPFLASIVKIAQKSLNVESKPSKQGEEKIMKVESEVQNVEIQEETNFRSEEEAHKIEVNQEKRDIKIEDNNKEGASANIKEEETVSMKNESIDEKNTKINKNLSSFSEYKSDKKIKGRKGKSSITDKFINDQNEKSNSKMSLQRPKIHSERPLKQKRPDRPLYKAENAFKSNIPKKQCLWVGGGPPGCQQWTKRHHPHNKGSENEQRCPSRSNQKQKKRYPDLCWEYDY